MEIDTDVDPELIALAGDRETPLYRWSFSYWVADREYFAEFRAPDAETARLHARALSRNRVFRGKVVSQGSLKRDTQEPLSYLFLDDEERSEFQAWLKAGKPVSLPSPQTNDRKSTHTVHRGRDWLPCYCAATSDHTLGEEKK